MTYTEDKTVTRKINSTIDYICQTKEIHCQLAIESGSRAWGFLSQDSDFDVRLIYCHNSDYYLSIFEQKDTFEFIDNQLFDVPFDIGGWDIKKALNLMYKSNTVIFEWLNSPIIYQSNDKLIKNLHEIQNDYFNPKAVFYHYQGMARNANSTLDLTQPIKLKKWFYLLRALLACNWVMQKQCMPPVSITPMFDLLKPPITKEIQELIILKANQDESYTHTLSARLQQFIYDLYNSISPDNLSDRPKGSIEPLNQIFKQAIYDH